MDVASLKKSIASHLHDPATRAVSDAQLLDFINDAARDAGNAGWLIDLDRSVIISSQNTDQFTVPANFVYILNIYNNSSPGATRLEQFYWKLVLTGGTPKIYLDTRLTSQTNSITIEGYKRPSTYTSDTDTIDVGIESFLRERALAYAARYMARSGSQIAAQYEQLFQDAFAVSDQILQQQLSRQLMMYNLREARRVPGR